MARLTFDQLVAQASLIGQNDATPLWVGNKFRAWLRKHYVDWAWPWLIRQATGITVNGGDNDIALGAGQGGINDQISRIFSPLYWRGQNFSQRGTASIRPIVGDRVESAIGMADPSQIGAPQSLIILPNIAADGRLGFSGEIYPTPDKTYTLAFTYQKLPDDISGATVPQYPNELTLIQAVKVAALEYDQTNDPVYLQEAKILADMVATDRTVYGSTPSFGDVMQLDSSVFLP